MDLIWDEPFAIKLPLPAESQAEVVSNLRRNLELETMVESS